MYQFLGLVSFCLTDWFSFSDRISCSSGWSGTLYLDQAGLELNWRRGLTESESDRVTEVCQNQTPSQRRKNWKSTENHKKDNKAAETECNSKKEQALFLSHCSLWYFPSVQNQLILYAVLSTAITSVDFSSFFKHFIFISSDQVQQAWGVQTTIWRKD